MCSINLLYTPINAHVIYFKILCTYRIPSLHRVADGERDCVVVFEGTYRILLRSVREDECVTGKKRLQDYNNNNNIYGCLPTTTLIRRANTALGLN